MRVKRADKRRMDEMRVEVGVKDSSKKKLVRSTWAGHIEKWEKENDKEQLLIYWRGNGGEEDRNCDGGLKVT